MDVRKLSGPAADYAFRISEILPALLSGAGIERHRASWDAISADAARTLRAALNPGIPEAGVVLTRILASGRELVLATWADEAADFSAAYVVEGGDLLVHYEN